MQYKEGTFVEGDFHCYINEEIRLNKKEMDRILKLDQKIRWNSEPADCISLEDKNGIVERKNNTFVFSGVRNYFCTNTNKKSSMINLIGTIMIIRNNKFNYKKIDYFP